MPNFNLNDVITDRIDKKVNYGMARTDYSPPVAPTSESRLSLIPNPTHNLWINSDNIPGTPPATNTADIGVYKYKSGETLGSGIGDIYGVIEMTRDTGVPNQRTWIACSTVDNDATILNDWVRFTYGGQYAVRFGFAYAGYGNDNYDVTAKSEWVELYPDTGGKEWYFDYEGGVWTMFGTPGTGQGSTVPDSKLTDGGAGNYTWSVYMMRGYRYVGTVGLKNYNTGAGSALIVIDESTTLSTGATKLTFTGTGVTATEPVANSNEILVTIPSGTLTVGETGTGSDVSVSSVGEIQFDVDSGFALTDLTGGIVKVAMESTFKNWNVSGQDRITATGVDEITIVAEDGITLTTAAPPNTTQTYYVIVNNSAYEIWSGAGGTGTQLTSLNFISAGTYVFDLQDATLASNQFELSSIAPDDAIYTNGVTYGVSNGSRIADGSTGAFLQIKGKNNTLTPLYDFSESTDDYTSGATITAQQKTLTIKGEDAFKTIKVADNADIVASSSTDVLEFEGSGLITITTDESAKKIIIGTSDITSTASEINYLDLSEAVGVSVTAFLRGDGTWNETAAHNVDGGSF